MLTDRFNAPVDGGTVVIGLYCHVEVLGSIPDQGEIYMENSISAVCPAHSAEMSKESNIN